MYRTKIFHSDDNQNPVILTVKKRYRRVLIILLVAAIASLLGGCYSALNYRVPDRITLIADREEMFDFSLPLEADFETEHAGSFFVNQKPLGAEQLTLRFVEPFSIQCDRVGSFSVPLKLFGIFEIKNVSFEVIENQEVIPCGIPIGITAKTNGIMVLGTGEVSRDDGSSYKPAEGIVLSGDYILQVNQKNVSNKEELLAELQRVTNGRAELTIRRNAKLMRVDIPVVESTGGDKKIGVWIRDDTQGIGTLTFVTTTGEFGALGHGITDVDTGLLMDIGEGTLYSAEIISVIKGRDGEPGELTGIIHQGKDNTLGSVLVNTPQGIFGRLLDYPERLARRLKLRDFEPYPVATKNEIREGAATILCSVDGEISECTISIEHIDRNGKTASKGLVIHITDETLIEKTGGIVQGMSGSPIIQNGKLIGAVTHVFVRDATRGYGIFIENMLKAK